jgi:hypothetical protein
VDWYLLIHQLPPRPLYLRAKIRNRLARVGAVAIKNSVYALPAREDCLEDFQWIAQEAAAGAGEAVVCAASFLAGISDEALVHRFKEAADAAYSGLRREVAAALERARRRAPVEPAALVRLRARFDGIAATDFFGARGRQEVHAMLRTLETRGKGKDARAPARRGRPELVGRVWVTRHGPKIDRMASAWLIRRFVDPAARFRFIDPRRETPRADQIGYDMPGGRFSHEGDRCTFETLAARLGIDDGAVRAIGEIVHDVDLKDGKYGRPEADGVRQLVEGLVSSCADDQKRLDRGLALFDDLYASYRGQPATRPRPARRKRRSPGARGR